MLADRAEISPNSLYRFEAGHADTKQGTIQAVAAVLEAAGIRFLPETDAEGEGIRLKKGAGEDA